VDYADNSWLFTCWHNLGPTYADTVDLTGSLTALNITFVAHPSIVLDLAGRRIVGATMCGEPADIAAIELKPHEKPPPPWFEGKRTLTIAGFNLPPAFRLSGHEGGEGIIVPILRHYLWQGFPGTDISAPPVSFVAADFPGSRGRYAWMLRYTPGGHPGASGCTVVLIRENDAIVAGIHVHYNTMPDGRTLEFHGRSTKDGRPIVAHASFEWGAAVPVELLYRAIDTAAPEGLSIANLSEHDLFQSFQRLLYVPELLFQTLISIACATAGISASIGTGTLAVA
jgi:hypothetical protein